MINLPNYITKNKREEKTIYQKVKNKIEKFKKNLKIYDRNKKLFKMKKKNIFIEYK